MQNFTTKQTKEIFEPYFNKEIFEHYQIRTKTYVKTKQRGIQSVKKKMYKLQELKQETTKQICEN